MRIMLDTNVLISALLFPGAKMDAMMSFEYVYTPANIESGLFDIRDVKDYPVLYTAIIEDVDVLVTGDKDFSNIDIEKPEIMSPAQFMEKFL